MKSFKYFLALPMAITALAACGSNSSFSVTDYETAVEVAENYKTSITNSKASSIVVSGHINSIAVKGDATWWASEELSGAGFLGLLSMIPNFSIKDSEITVDSQDIASFSLPGALTTLLQVATGGSGSKIMLTTIANLPKFPMNAHLLKLINGFDSLHMDKKDNVHWDEIQYKKWEFAKVNYYTGGGRLKVELETEDIESFFDEVEERFDADGTKEEDPDPEEKKFPAYFSITTNNIGYIDSLSVKFKVEDIDAEFGEDTEIMYGHIKGNAELDLGLTFKQKVSSPLTLKYQLSYYDIVKPEEAEIVYNYRDNPLEDPEGFTPRYLKYNSEKSKGPTASLSDLKDYVTFDWFSNTKTMPKAVDDGPDRYTLVKNYDDPIFEYDYWNSNEKNVAFTDETYDALVLPAYSKEAKAVKPKYSILGAYPRESFGGGEVDTHSLCSTSIDGRLVSSNTGIPYDGGKFLENASDALQMVYVEEDKSSLLMMDEIFINSNLLHDGDSEYIINIAIAPYLGGN